MRGLTGLVGDPAGRILHLGGGLVGGGLALPGGLVGRLPCLLGRPFHHVLHPGVLGRLVHDALELGVGVGHLLDLGLRLLGELLHDALELGAVAPHAALYPAHRLPEEVLGLPEVLVLLRLLLNVLRSFAHWHLLLGFALLRRRGARRHAHIRAGGQGNGRGARAPAALHYGAT